jgi:C4-dicarboxylate-specific signal transduction histidine kinase
MRMGAADDERVLADLEKVVEQVMKATEIITHLRTFGRAAPVTVEPVSVNDVIERSLSLMQEQLRLRQVEVELDLCADAPVVLGNPIQLEQVFINLLTNARDALMDAKRRTIMIECTLNGGVVAVVFRDTGPGIPEGLEQRIFDPFFTTKEVGTGTGLGLSITYSIVKEHGGEITVSRSPEGGASFRLELPVAKGEPREEPLL